MTNNQEQKSIKERVLEKIKSKHIKMRPKFYFVLKTVLLAVGFFMVGALVLFLISFISFHLRASGIWYLPGFGPRGWGIYLRLMPWFLILAGLILILMLEILSKRCSFVWRRPVIYSF